MKSSFAPLESDEQRWLFNWAYDMARLKYPELELMFHIPNGGSRNKAEASRLKKQGVKPGVPDVFLPVPKGIYHGLWIEMKRSVGGKTSEFQDDMLKKLQEQGYYVAVCHGFQNAADTIEKYMECQI